MEANHPGLAFLPVVLPDIVYARSPIRNGCPDSSVVVLGSVEDYSATAISDLILGALPLRAVPHAPVPVWPLLPVLCELIYYDASSIDAIRGDSPADPHANLVTGLGVQVPLGRFSQSQLWSGGFSGVRLVVK